MLKINYSKQGKERSMKKKGLVFVLVLSLVISLIPAGVFASEIETSLEAGFGGGAYGNCCTIQAGKSKTVQFYVGEDDGNELSFNKKISPSDKDFTVYDDSGEKTSAVKLLPLKNGKMKITPDSSISRRTSFNIKYTGSEYKFSSGDTFLLTVTASASSAAAIKKSSVSDPAARADKNGIQISFKEMKNVDGYRIYRSTKKTSGYKLISKVSRNSFYDCALLKKGTRYYYKVRGYAESTGTPAYSKYSKTVSAKSQTTLTKATAKSVTSAHLNLYDKNLLKEAYLFGLSNNIKFNYNATQKTDVLNNLQYAFLIGDYKLGFAYKTREKAEAACEMIFDIMVNEEYDGIYADLFCAYNNSILEFQTDYECGVYCIYMSVKNASLTDEKIFSNQKKAVTRIKEIAAELREQGKIKSGMSQKEIAEVYYNYVSNADVDHFSDDKTVLSKGLCMQEDTPYSFLLERYASCLGHTATYNQFLHYEGIQAYGLSNWFGSVEGENGHIISYIVCDGEEYFTDTTNHIPLTDQKEIEKHLIFRDDSLQKAKAAAKNFS